MKLIRDIDEAIEVMGECKELALDIETSGLVPFKDKVAVLTLYDDTTDAAAILHVRGVIIPKLKAFLEKPGRLIVGHNIINFDMPFLAGAGVNVFAGQRYYDTLVGETVVTVTGRRNQKNTLEKSLQRHLGAVINKKIDHKSWMNPVLNQEQIEYCQGDIVHLHALMRSQWKKAKETGQEEALKLEVAIMPAILRMAVNGLPVDEQRFLDYLDEQEKKAVSAEGDIYETLGRINLNSPAQLKKALAGIGVDVQSTAKDTLKDLSESDDHTRSHIGKLLTVYRIGSQRVKMFREWYENYVPDGRARSRFWQCGADTGRFTSSGPNLQQIPGDMRAVFGNVPGYMVGSADYSQIEVVVAAIIAAETGLLDIIKNPETDLHSVVARQLFGIPENVHLGKESRERKLAKCCSFCLLFGGGKGTLYRYAKNNGSKITLDEAGALVLGFFKMFPNLYAVRNSAYKRCETAPMIVVTLPSGLKRKLIGESLKGTTLLNTTVQGTAAAGLKRALEIILERDLDKYLCAAVHDELVVVAPKDEINQIMADIKQAMIDGMIETLYKVTKNPQIREYIPNIVRVGVNIGTTWEGSKFDEKHSLGFFEDVEEAVAA